MGALAQTQKSIECSQQARDLFVAAGDRRGAAVTLLIVGDVLFDESDYVGARKQFDEALSVFQEIGAARNIRSTVERIGNVYYKEGNLHEAKKYYGQALRFDRQINDPRGWPAITGAWRMHLRGSVTWRVHLRCTNNPWRRSTRLAIGAEPHQP